MSFDPDAPGTIGANWLLANSGQSALNAATDVAAMRLNSRANETIDKLIVPHTWAGAGSGFGKMWAEIYDTSDLGANQTTQEATHYPNEDKYTDLMFDEVWNVLTLTNGFPRIDDAADDDTDYVIGTYDSELRVAFNTAAFSNTRRVLYVKFIVRAMGFYGMGNSQMRLDLYNNTTYVATLGSFSPPTDSDGDHRHFRDYTVGPFYINPLTEEPWSQPDIVSFDTGTALLIALHYKPCGAIGRVRMVIGYETEKRVAVGPTVKITSPPAGVQSNDYHLLKTPLNVDNWAKATAKDYLVVVRRLWDPQGVASTLTPSVSWLSGADVPHLSGRQYSSVVADSSGRLTSLGSLDAKTYGLILGTSGGAISSDSQPYYDIAAQDCHTSSTLKQFISQASAAAQYGLVKAVLGFPAASVPTAALTVKVKRTSDNVQMGGTGTLATADIATGNTLLGTYDGITYYIVNVTLASAVTLAAATDYYIEFTSTCTSAKPWKIAMLDFTQTHALTGNASYQGATDYADVAGSSKAASGDFNSTFSTVATPPSAPAPDPTIGGIGAGVGQASMPSAGNVLCDPGSMRYCRLSWTGPSPALGAAFLRYEIQRSNDNGTTWESIATVALEATLVFNDWESPRNTNIKYRIRSVRTDGATSAWATTSTTNIPMTGSAILFVTNTTPTLNTGYILLGQVQSYKFLSANDVVLAQMEGRAMSVAFRPLVNRGYSWSGAVLVYSDGNRLTYYPANSPGDGIAAFDPIRGIAEADLPYVCVLRNDGTRLLALLRVTDGVETQPAQHYVASWSAVQLTTTPYVVSA